PTTNFFGADSFTFKVNDGQTDSAPALVALTINRVNHPPVANAQSVTVVDQSQSILLTGSDFEGSPLTFAIVSSPTNGTLSGTPPNVVYSPQTNFVGADGFTFKVNDGSTDSAPAHVSITVLATNLVVTSAADDGLGTLRQILGKANVITSSVVRITFA